MRLPDVLPDESLYSRICRHLTIMGLSCGQYLNYLQGNERVAIHPSLTSGLERMKDFYDEPLEEVLRQQTLISLFSYYLTKHVSVISNPVSSAQQLIRACQLSTFRETEYICAKFCSKCAEEDIHKHGVAYWHCLHQIPGVEACHLHNVWLEHLNLPKRTHIAAYLLPRPTKYKTYCCSPLAAQYSIHAEKIFNSIKRGEFPNEFDYRLELTKKGFITKEGHVRRKALVKELYSIVQSLFPSVHNLKPKHDSDYSYWASVFAGKHNQHPFKHMVFDFFLQSQITHHSTSTTEKFSLQNNELELRCCNLLLQGNSMAQVSRSIEKSRCYVKSIALRYGIAVKLNPKMISEPIRCRIIKMAWNGVHRKTIANRFSISTGSVEMFISTTKGLVAWRKKCKVESMRRRYKHQIVRFIEYNPGTCRQFIKKNCNAAYFWLYHHCRDWLENILPAPQKSKHRDRVDWVKRDETISRKVSAILSLQLNPISRTELDRMLGGHGWLTSKLHKMPKTSRLLLTSTSYNRKQKIK